MKGRENKAAPSADLLVCFPSRAHLQLMPKPICSPARPSEPSKRHHHNHHHHRLKKSTTTRGGGGSGGGHASASPLLWAKNKQMSSEISEPTSPKVTCAGQIKVRHKTTACKSWQSVMEEIERIHNNKKHKKRSSWMQSLGLKKDVMQFLTCLRNIRFDFRCFGAFPAESEITSDDDEDEEEEEYEENNRGINVDGRDGNCEGSRTVFSKWFTVLQENQEERKLEKERSCNDDHSADAPSSVPPPNALLLMRCRSAPAKSWLEEKQEEEQEEQEEGDGSEENEEQKEEKEEKKGKKLETLMEEDNGSSKKENLVVMRYDTDFYKISTDIAKETWVVGGIRDPFSKSRSWKR